MYWHGKGKSYSEKTATLTLERANQLGIKDIVIASNSGDSIYPFLNKNLNIVCVTHQAGFREDGICEMSDKKRKELESYKVKVLTTTHLFAGITRNLQKQFGGIYFNEAIANSLRMFSQGVKVGVEVAIMALDAGLIPFGNEIIAVGGSGRGMDTAIILQPAHSHKFFQTKILEIICKPRIG